MIRAFPRGFALRIFVRLLALFTVLFALHSFAADRDPKLLMQADRDFAKATAEKKVEGWMSYMAPNAVLLGAEPIVGLEQIRAAMTKELGEAGAQLTWEPTKADFVGNTGDLGYTIGRFERRSAGGDGKPRTQKGSYMTTWKLQNDGSWKVVGDIGTPDPQ